MSNKKQNEELQSRREFFKKAAKAALPVVGAAVLSSIPLLQTKASTGCDGCWYSCYNSCQQSCHGTCSSCNGQCASDCQNSCLGGCQGNCSGSCQGTCYTGCSSSSWL